MLRLMPIRKTENNDISDPPLKKRDFRVFNKHAKVSLFHLKPDFPSTGNHDVDLIAPKEPATPLSRIMIPESEREDNPFYDGFTNHDIDRKGAMCLLNSEEGAFIFFNASPISPSMQIERSAISFGA